MDVHSILHDWSTLETLAIFSLAVPSLLIFIFSGLAAVFTASTGLVATSVMVTVCLAYTLTWRSFSHERGENALAGIMASPISVIEFFLGKSLAVFLFGYPFLLAAAAASGLDIKIGVFPSISAFAMALLAIPVDADPNIKEKLLSLSPSYLGTEPHHQHDENTNPHG
jgi:hypothetical protein